MNPKQGQSCRGRTIVTQRTMCSKSCTQNLFFGLTLPPPVRQSIYKKIASEVWQLWQNHLANRQ
jgi:hypothetical protein